MPGDTPLQLHLPFEWICFGPDCHCMFCHDRGWFPEGDGYVFCECQAGDAMWAELSAAGSSEP